MGGNMGSSSNLPAANGMMGNIRQGSNQSKRNNSRQGSGMGGRHGF
jgi:hypothetical protein